MATTLQRRRVAADNSCLFAAFAVLCEGATSATHIRTATRRLRAQCAATVLADPEPETRAVLLGMDSVQAYAEWIVDETHWGGEPEIVILSNIYNVDVALISCETLRETRYPAKEGAGLIFLLYTGQHYDPLIGEGEVETLKFPSNTPGDIVEALCKSAILIAEQHNAEAAKRAAEKRVKRLKCGGCGAVLDNSSAFQQHCASVEHDDDFIYDCEEVEIVVAEGEAMPDSSIDLESPEVHAFYNASSPTALSLSTACALAPFELEGQTFGSFDSFWRSEAVASASLGERQSLLLTALRAQYRSGAARESGLLAHLLSTGDKLLACVDLDPWLGVQAAGGISTGENNLGKALQQIRSELGAEVGAA